MYSSTNKVTGATETWNGTNWTETADLTTARQGQMGGAGASTSSLAFGGFAPPETAATEEFTGAGALQ